MTYDVVSSPSTRPFQYDHFATGCTSEAKAIEWARRVIDSVRPEYRVNLYIWSARFVSDINDYDIDYVCTVRTDGTVSR